MGFRKRKHGSHERGITLSLVLEKSEISRTINAFSQKDAIDVPGKYLPPCIHPPSTCWELALRQRPCWPSRSGRFGGFGIDFHFSFFIFSIESREGGKGQAWLATSGLALLPAICAPAARQQANVWDVEFNIHALQTRAQRPCGFSCRILCEHFGCREISARPQPSNIRAEPGDGDPRSQVLWLHRAKDPLQNRDRVALTR